MDRIGLPGSQRIGRFHAVSLRSPSPPCWFCCFALISCRARLFEKNRLQAVDIAAGELVVLTRTSPTTYYETPEGPAGFEYDLVKGFADYLGVNPRFIVVPKFNDILPRFLEGEGDMAAAGITVTEARARRGQFGPPYQEIQQQVVYRLGTDRPPAISGDWSAGRSKRKPAPATSNA